MHRPTIETVRIILLAIVAGTLVTTLVVVTVGVFVLLDNSAKAKAQRVAALEVAQESKGLARLLVECTTAPQFREPAEDPKKVAASDCYARQQAATADFVGEPRGPINSVTVIAAACGADHPGNIAATRTCVEKGLGQ